MIYTNPYFSFAETAKFLPFPINYYYYYYYSIFFYILHFYIYVVYEKECDNFKKVQLKNFTWGIWRFSFHVFLIGFPIWGGSWTRRSPRQRQQWWTTTQKHFIDWTCWLLHPSLLRENNSLSWLMFQEFLTLTLGNCNCRTVLPPNLFPTTEFQCYLPILEWDETNIGIKFFVPIATVSGPAYTASVPSHCQILVSNCECLTITEKIIGFSGHCYNAISASANNYVK